jgi:hypothetical protein
MVEWRADGVATLNDGMLYSQRERVVTLARENRLVGVHPETGFVEAGGLISYGPNWPAPGSEDTELGVFDGTGGGSWRDGSLPASSSLRLCG